MTTMTIETARRQPATKAGRDFLATFIDEDDDARQAILAIEDESLPSEAEFWKAAGEWQKAGSGMTKEQETGAAMAWSWITSRRSQERAAKASPRSCRCPECRAGWASLTTSDRRTVPVPGLQGLARAALQRGRSSVLRRHRPWSWPVR